jgi:hypothetical protein
MLRLQVADARAEAWQRARQLGPSGKRGGQIAARLARAWWAALPVLAVAGAVAAAACHDGVKGRPLGADCEASAECRDPYVCVRGRCHEKCKSAADCPGTVCLPAARPGDEPVCALDGEGQGGHGAGGAGGAGGGGQTGSGAGGSAGASCDDQLLDGDETDVDCGGSCPPCANDKSCEVAADCESGYCEQADVCEPCAASAQCSSDQWCDTTVNGGTCIADLAQGEACQQGAQCPGDACVDGCCCDSACGGICQACSHDMTGQLEGSCASVTSNTDPDGERGSGKCVDGVCNACAVEVAAGSEHTCARKQDGTLWCWGRNNEGQLGDGTTVGKPSPVEVSLSCP